VTDGIVLASDSATTFTERDGSIIKVYNNANKIFNIVKGIPVGAMTFGSGNIGTASIATISKDLREQFGKKESDYYFDHDNYSMEEVALLAGKYFTERMKEEYPQGADNYYMGYWVCGYGTGDESAQALSMAVGGKETSQPQPLYMEGHYGPRWDGDREALDRLILGCAGRTIPALVQSGLPVQRGTEIHSLIVRENYRELFLPAMPIQDAIDLARFLARFLAETAAKFSHFSLQAATVGGQIEIATITKHEGFKWISRKHYFDAALNAGEKHA